MEAVVTVTRPDLTPEERAIRMQRLEKSLAAFFIAMRRQEMMKGEENASSDNV